MWSVLAKVRSGPLATALGLSDQGEAHGHVFDPNDPSARFVVEILADGLPVGLVRADIYREELRSAGCGDGCYGFVAVLPPPVLAGDVVIEAQVANTSTPIGSPLVADRLGTQVAAAGIAEVRWAGGLRLTGWLADRESFGHRVKAIVDGRVVAEVPASGWTHREYGAGYVVVPAFDIHLPAAMADGRVRYVDVVAADDTPLRGTPCFVIAFEDGLTAFIDGRAELESERMRARYAERLIPQSMPFVAVPDWMERFRPSVGRRPDPLEIGVVLIGEAGFDISVQSLMAQENVVSVAASIPHQSSTLGFRPQDVLAFLAEEAPKAALVVFATAGTIFEPAALWLMAAALDGFPQAASAYCDTCLRSPDGSLWPIALTAFDYERCLEQAYCAQVFAMRRDAVVQALSNGADTLVRLFNAQLDVARPAAAEPVHVPVILAEPPWLAQSGWSTVLERAAAEHLGARGMPCTISARRAGETASIRITRVVPGELVSVVITTRQCSERLDALIGSLRATSGAIPVEIIVAYGGSSAPEALARLETLARDGARSVRIAGPFNAYRVRNAGAAAAQGAFVLFLDDDLAPVETGWLDELMGRMAGPDVGAAGPMTQWSSGIVRSAGLVLGPGLAGAPAQADRLRDEPGYAALLETAHEVSAIGADCLLTRRDLFAAIGGFDAFCFVTRYGDIDFCLRLRARGLRIVVSPDAWLTASGSSRRLDLVGAGSKQRAARERDVLQARWGEVILADPYYSPWLAIEDRPFSALAWPPRSQAARQRHHAGARAVPFGL